MDKEKEQLEKAKDSAYWERNQLVAALSKLFPSHLAKHADNDPEWEEDWRTIVCIHLPTGQVTWHIHDSEVGYFDHLLYKENHWDGHSAEEKYRRLRKLETLDEE